MDLLFLSSAGIWYPEPGPFVQLECLYRESFCGWAAVAKYSDSVMIHSAEM